MLAQTGAAQPVEAQPGSGTSDPNGRVGEGTHSGYTEGTEDAGEEALMHWSPSCHPACCLHRGSSSTGTPQLQNLRSRKNQSPPCLYPSSPSIPPDRVSRCPKGSCPSWHGHALTGTGRWRRAYFWEGGFKPRAPAWQHPTAKTVPLITES